MIALDLAGGRPLRVVALGAHADDIEIGAGGLLMTLLGMGRISEIDWFVASAFDVRAAEARASAVSMVGDRALLRVEVGEMTERYFPHLPELKSVVDDLGRHTAPDLVLSPRLEDRHQDHRTIAELAWQAFRDHLILEYEIPKYEGDLGTPNVFVPLDPAIVTGKVAHLVDAFPSQRERRWFDEDAFRAILRLRAIECNAPSGYAEGFTARKIVLDGTPSLR